MRVEELSTSTFPLITIVFPLIIAFFTFVILSARNKRPWTSVASFFTALALVFSLALMSASADKSLQQIVEAAQSDYPDLPIPDIENWERTVERGTDRSITTTVRQGGDKCDITASGKINHFFSGAAVLTVEDTLTCTNMFDTVEES